MPEESVIRLSVHRPEGYNGIGKLFSGLFKQAGDYLFPGKDFYDREACHCVSELLARHGGACTPQAFLSLLETFTPAQHR